MARFASPLMEHQILPKWEAMVSTRLTKASADQIWPLFMDFFNIQKWFPGQPTCYGIHGTNGETGCIRYCAGFSLTSQENSTTTNGIRWSKERLTAIDPIQRTLIYEIVECNIGFKSYTSTVKIVPCFDDDGDGCHVEWSFVVDPVEGWRLEDFVKRYKVALQNMAMKMEDYAIRISQQEQAEEPKWEGKATAKLRGLAVEQVWPLLEDFYSINKWLPSVDTCYQVNGVYEEPGLVRYCASTISSSDPGTENSIKWCHEKLLAMDPIQHYLSYEVLDNNIGFKSYVSRMEVFPIVGDKQLGCQIEWSFVSDPVEGLTFENLCAYIESSLQGMAEKMEKALK